MLDQATTEFTETSGVSQLSSPTWLRKIGIALAGSLAVAGAAHVAVPLPWTPVPFTLQPMAVLLVGLLAGPSLGFATLILYLAEGAVGMPVFQPHGPGGILQLAGPTGGFLWSYPVVAMVASKCYRMMNSRPRFIAALYACLAAIALLYTAGAAQFAALTHLTVKATLVSAVLPFFPGEFVKALAAAGVVSALAMRTRQ